MKYKLIGSAPTKERLLLLICNYFYSDCKFVDNKVHNSKGEIEGYRVVEKDGRFRLESCNAIDLDKSLKVDLC